jgi:ribulose-phosphate 3-epimerase
MSIKPKTSPNGILKYLEYIDMLLVMTVEPGFGGQKFMQDCAEKIPLIKSKAQKDLIIQVDGGINDETAKICTNFGATSLVAGNYIYNAEDIENAIISLR